MSEFSWTEQNTAVMKEMWLDGQPASAIARRLNCSRNAVIGKIYRMKGGLPQRPARARKVSSPSSSPGQSQARSSRLNSFNVPAIRKVRAAAIASPVADPNQDMHHVSPWVEGAERGARSDLSRFRLAGVDPKPFAALGRHECRFPLVCFEDKSGPDMPCCGAETDPLSAYCDAHMAVAAGRDA